jgi:triosephosphate isomerase (TIM)
VTAPGGLSAPRRPLVVANWKMYMTTSASVAYLQELLPLLPRSDDREIAVAPAFVSLQAVAGALRGSAVRLAAQDLATESGGAYTGEISGEMLQELGVTYVLVGHSERRQQQGETDHIVAKKMEAALRSDLMPILCLGEEQEARESGRAPAIVRAQLLRGLERVPRGAADRVLVAYEPVWAIGTGRSATPSDASEMQALIRQELKGVFGEAGEATRILYGGSVSSANIDEFLGPAGLDGALVGGASLKADPFARIASFRPHS